jgi:hypothetical protein
MNMNINLNINRNDDDDEEEDEAKEDNKGPTYSPPVGSAEKKKPL